MLRYFAERLRSAIRGSDVPIRLGGDEFLVPLPECKGSEAQLVLNRLNGIAAELDGRKIPIGFAVGWTEYVPGESSQTLMKRVDTALYADKRFAKGNCKASEEISAGKGRGHITNAQLATRWRLIRNCQLRPGTRYGPV